MFTPTEPNDTILLANLVDLDALDPQEGSGEIGDNPNLLAANDVDLFQVELNAGDTLSADINAAIDGSDLDAVITIFDANGDLLVQNDDNSFERDGETVIEPDPFQSFTALLNGTYYVGISSSGNLDYDPNVADSGIGESSGSYSLVLTYEPSNDNSRETEPNDTILSADVFELDGSSLITVNGEIGNNPALDSINDVDLFAFELNEGETLSADVNAAIIGSSLDAVVTIFDSNGDLLVQQEDNSFEQDGETVTERDPFLLFTASEDGTYYVGVSSSGNLDYDPTDAGSGIGSSFGAYNVQFTLDDGETEPNDTILSAITVMLDSSSPLTVVGEIGNNSDLDPANDVDLYEFELTTGETLFVDVDDEINGSALEAILTIFDADGNQLSQNGDDLDSLLRFTADEDGTYYIGVSSSGNLGYDPTVAGSGIGESSGSYSLELTLNAINNDEPNDTIRLAQAVELDSSSPITVTGEIGDNPSLLAANDVDLYEVELDAGETLSVAVDDEINGSALEAGLTIFDANGIRLVQNEDGLDSSLEFTADEDGTYYVGVSSSVNLDYDPNVAGSGTGDSSGSYSLELSLDGRDGDLFTTPIIRFQNSDLPGTYLFAGEAESQGIRANFPNFIEEGQAFKVAVEEGDDLIRINRFQNSNVPGTYLYAGEAESQGIRANFPNFIEEGVAFYVYDGAANRGVDFYRFQNTSVPGTYIFVAGEERQNILTNFPNFEEEDVAFEVEI